MKTIAYYNGKITEQCDAFVPMLDRACFFGDGVYDACYSFNHRVFTLGEHIDRLYKSAEALKIRVPAVRSDLEKTITELVPLCDDGEDIVYFQVTRGTAPRNHAFKNSDANLWITVTPKKITPKDKRMNLLTVTDNRYSMCNVKTLNLVPNVLAATRAADRGCDEAVFHMNGRITECAHSNIHILEKNVLYTPPRDGKILAGIGADHLFAACRKLGIEVVFAPFFTENLFEADEVILTSAGTFCAPARTVDGAPVGGKDSGSVKNLQEILYGEFYAATR